MTKPPRRSTSQLACRTSVRAVPKRLWLSTCVLAALVLPASIALAQNSAGNRSDSPVAPSAAVGAGSTGSTFSLMGLAGIKTEADSPTPTRDVFYTGISQPIGKLHGVRFTAIGTGYWTARDAVGTAASMEGAVAVRALGRINGIRSWAAVRYGRAGALGGVLGEGFGGESNNIGFDGGRTDTTVSRHVDVGTVGRAEAGIVTSRYGVDFALGMSLERATRVTTQTISIESNGEFPTAPMQPPRTTIVRTLRGVQRREIATGLASLGWSTGRTSWLASVTAPMAAWITSDALAPRPRIAPAVASLAVVHPITAWLSAIGSASTNTSTVGNTTLRDDIALTRRSDFAPVFALGVSIVRVPFRGRHHEGAPNGILSFESRIIESPDSAAIPDVGVDSVRGAAAPRAFHVQLVIDAPNAASIELMGDATAWLVTNMNRGGDGRWRVELKVPTGANRISVRTDGGEWTAPPGLPTGNSDFGNPVGLLLVVDQSRITR